MNGKKKTRLDFENFLLIFLKTCASRNMYATRRLNLAFILKKTCIKVDTSILKNSILSGFNFIKCAKIVFTK